MLSLRITALRMYYIDNNRSFRLDGPSDKWTVQTLYLTCHPKGTYAPPVCHVSCMSGLRYLCSPVRRATPTVDRLS